MITTFIPYFYRAMKIPQKLALRYARARINILALSSTRKAALKAYRLFCTPQQRVPGKTSALFRKGERLTLRYDGHKIRGHCWLPAEPPVKKVLIAHGFESASRHFDSYIAALVDKGYTVMAFDAPAHGESGGRRITLPAYINVLRLIEQQYGPFEAYLGHSLGALALTLFLETSPHNETTRLVLIAPAVEMTTALASFARLFGLSADVVREMDTYAQEVGGHHFAWYSLRRALQGVHAGVFYLQDQDDRITPLKDALLVQKDGRYNIRFLFTKGLGHRKILKDPATLDQVLAFL
jgi:pimeloyl-ACP methyl ester carboxylesterase